MIIDSHHHLWTADYPWPVCELVAPYGETWHALVSCLAGLSDAERAAILGGTAIRTYRLETHP
jgi:L-fuconolactonase